MRPIVDINVNIRTGDTASGLSLGQWDHLSTELILNLKDAGNPFNLTGCTVQVSIIKADREQYKLSDLVTIPDAAGGKVKVLLTSLDLCVPGYSYIEVKVLEGSSILTTNRVGFDVRRSAEAAGEKSVPPLKRLESELLILTEECQDIRAVELVRVSNETAREAAEPLRISAETTRVLSETTRNQNENVRMSNEADRVFDEAIRLEKESDRQLSEGNRKESEASRLLAEGNRVGQESSRENQEATRVNNETARVLAEEAREIAESGRASSEITRLSKESERLSAELTRITNESGRTSAEANRIAAELNRVTSFNTILTAYQASIASQSNVEVTAARDSLVLSKVFPSLDLRLENIEADLFGASPGMFALNAPTAAKVVTDSHNGLVDLEISGRTDRNLVRNGNFNQNTDYWIASGATLAAANNSMNIYGNGTNLNVRASQNLQVKCEDFIGKRLYIGQESYISHDNVQSMYMSLRGTTVNGTIQVGYIANNPLRSKVYNNGAILNIMPDMAGQMQIDIRIACADPETANGKILVLRKMVAIILDDSPYVKSYEAVVGRPITVAEADMMFWNYFEGIKSTTKVNVKSVKKNLFDNKLAPIIPANNTTVTIEGDKLVIKNTDSGSYKRAIYEVLLQPNTTYTLSRVAIEITGGQTSKGVMGITRYEDGLPFSSYVGKQADTMGEGLKSATFTTGISGRVYVYMFASYSLATPTTVEFTNIQLELGNVATTYEPFDVTEIKIECTNPAKFDLAMLMNRAKNEINISKGYLSAVRRVSAESILQSGDVTSLGASQDAFGYSWFAVAKRPDNVVNGNSVTNLANAQTMNVNGWTPIENRTVATGAYQFVNYSTTTYAFALPLGTTLVDAKTLIAGLSTRYQITSEFITFEDFGKYGINVTGELTSNKSLTNFSAESTDLLPDIKLTYPMSVVVALNGIKDVLEFTKYMLQRHETRMDQCDAKNVVDGFGTEAPTTGSYLLNQKIWNTNPVPGGYTGWICTTAGTPGTWKGFGLIQA